jgi:hypothetical protein
MKKEQEACLLHDHRFGKGERHAHKTGETLPQGVISPLDMGGFSPLFSHGGMLLLWDHRRMMTESYTVSVLIHPGYQHPPVARQSYYNRINNRRRLPSRLPV